MKNIFLVFYIFLITLEGNLLEKYQWEKRIIIVFGDNSFQDKASSIYKNEKPALEDRDILWIKITPDKGFDSKSSKEFYKTFRVKQDETRFFLIGKDGGIKLQSNGVIQPQRLYLVIDAMPMRQAEMRSKY